MNETADLDAIFAAAIEIASPTDRAAYVDRQCGDDTALKAQVERLIAAHFRAGDFLKNLTVPLATNEHVTVAEQAGTVIGPYKLLQQVGEGGMGVVFMAEQSAPIQRSVAIKIIKPGMDSRQVIARFEAERQAIAMMDHPNIAKVLDAGTTDSGRPYFVMELVKGIPITKYCDDHKLSVRQRLDLFLPVCQAVQHAHQKGIIHRDIKPTNVLIAEYDDRAVPKIIDFGVAKATAQKLTERTMFTEFGQIIGTVEYMSPEQAKFNQLDIDTRSDIYSLGVLLYELLTGSTPFERDLFRSAAFDEVLRIIREEEPPKPSTRLSSSETLTSIAANRHTEPARLSRDVCGELDWIVMKCLEKDRNRRYETANGLSRDIKRYLADEPVQACPPSAAYRFRKFARRNRAQLTTAFLVALSLVLATIFSIRQATLANHSERLAQTRLAQADTQRAKADAISKFLQEMLASANPDQKKPASYSVRELLDDFSANFSDQLKDQPEVEATIHAVIGKAYWRLGLSDDAEPHLKAALDLRCNLFGPEDNSVAESLIDYAWNLAEAWRHEEALEYVDQALSIYQRSGARREVLGAMWSKQRFQISTHKYKEADVTARAAIAAAGDLSSTDVPEVANILHALGDSLFIQGRYGEAETSIRDALTLHRRLHGPDHPETAWCLWVLGRSLAAQGDFEQAESQMLASFDIFRRLYDGKHKSVKLTSTCLELIRAEMHVQSGQWKQAVVAFDKATPFLEADKSGAFWTERYMLATACNDAAWRIANVRTATTDDGRQAVELVQIAVHLQPNSAKYLTTLGLAQYRAGVSRAAIESLNKAIELSDGGDACAQLILAMSACHVGNRDIARTAFDSAVDWLEKNDADNQELRALRDEAAGCLEKSITSDR